MIIRHVYSHFNLSVYVRLLVDQTDPQDDEDDDDNYLQEWTLEARGQGTCPEGFSLGRGGMNYKFDSSVTKHFLARNKLQLLIRSHQMCREGYRVHHDGLCVTVFSAPKYCGGQNLGALIRFDSSDTMKYRIVQFAAVQRRGFGFYD